MFKPFSGLLLPVLSLLIIVSGCGQEPQCLDDSDCIAPDDCSEVSCNEGICETNTIDDCCGNGVCESAVENECTCSEDCGDCAGYLSYTNEVGEMVQTEYLRRRCSEIDLCEISYSEDEQVYKEEFHEITTKGVVFNVILSYLNPMAIRKNNVTIEIELVEINDPRITYPLTITSALVLDGAILFGRSDDRYQFQSSRERVEIVVPIVGAVKLPEERHNLRARINFEYTYLDEKQVMEDGMLVYDAYGDPVMRTVRDRVVRSTLLVGLAETVTLMNLGAK